MECRIRQGRITGVTTKQNAAAATVNVATSINYQPMSRLVQQLWYGSGLNAALRSSERPARV